MRVQQIKAVGGGAKREKAAEKRCNRGGEVGWAHGTEWYKGGARVNTSLQMAHQSPRLAVYSLQGNLSTGTDPGPTDVTDGDDNTTNSTSENTG